MIDRPTTTVERLPELPEGVVVPDDLSGLTGPRRRLLGFGWPGWLALILLAGVIALLVIVDFDGTTAPWGPGEGPGSNSLDGAVATQTAVAVVPDVITPTATATPFAVDEGPGSNSLSATTPSLGSWASTMGPGSHSLEAQLETELPWADGDGPGSHSLGG